MDSKNTENSKKNHCCKINRDSLPYKLHYLLFCGARGAILPYIIVFIKDKLNLSGSSLATMLVVRSFLITLSKPAIGMIVDYFNKLKFVMIFLSIGEIVFYFLMIWVPRVERVHNEAKILESGNFFQNSSYLAMYEINEGRFTFTFKDSNLHHNNSDDCSSFIPAFQCNRYNETDSPKTLQCATPITNATFNGSVYDEKKLLSQIAFLSNSNNNVFFNCFLQSSDNNSNQETETTLNTKTEQKNSNGIMINFAFKLNSNSFMQKQMDCLLLTNAVSFHDLNCLHLTKPLKTIGEITQTKTRSVYATYQYYLCGLLWIVAGICTNTMFTLSDTACYECIHSTGQDYGRQRLWGAVSWGLISPATGFVNDFVTGNSETPNYMAGFYAFGILTIIEIINLARLDLRKPPRSSTFFKDFKKIFTSKEFDIFVTAVFLIGFFTSFVWYYLMVYIESIGGNRFLMGLVNTSQCFLGEIPFMFFSGWITKKLGHFQVLTVSFTIFGLRFACYHLINNPWYLLPVESMHGLTYGIFYTAMTAYAKVSALPGTEATTQSILCATYEGLGVGVGAIVSGICFEHFGYKHMFLLACITSLCCAGCLFVISIVIQIKKKKTTK